MQITVVGQGYVGLPLAIAAVNAGYTVYGLDNNEEKINSLVKGISVIEDLTDNKIKESINSKRDLPTTDKGVVADSEVILMPRVYGKIFRSSRQFYKFCIFKRKFDIDILHYSLKKR